MIWNFTDKAKLTMKNFKDEELKIYLSKISDEKLYSYNVYQIEGEGKSLFHKIEGDENTIMGLPIKNIKEYLKKLRSLKMKKHLIIGDPIEHSLSPKIHNYWFKKNDIQAIYEKKKLVLKKLKI